MDKLRKAHKLRKCYLRVKIKVAKVKPCKANENKQSRVCQAYKTSSNNKSHLHRENEIGITINLHITQKTKCVFFVCLVFCIFSVSVPKVNPKVDGNDGT